MVTASGAIAQAIFRPRRSAEPPPLPETPPSPEPPLLLSIASAGQLIGLQSRRSRTIKRAGDIVFSLAALSLGAPVFLALGVLIKLTSRGPVFYVQRRLGRDHTPFGCIKFRTMRRDADKILSALLLSSPDLEEEFRNDFKLKNDPRITRLGKFLRRSSLDELPQFLNVLRGEMSVVGPRPIVPQETDRYGEHMHEVLSLRPGLTGLWQVSGRNNLSYAERVQLDLRYSRHRSFLLDLKIILKTIAVVLDPRDRGAY
ncbi:MAG: sugar transferase [Synechococcus sp.]|nr:sugar transferase [Synechococcus sp.]